MTTVTENPQAFYRTDYGRFARTLQQARHLRGSGEAKPDAAQATIDAAASALADVFAGEDMTGREEHQVFDRDAFLAGTRLPEPRTWDYDGDDEDDDEDEDDVIE